MSARGIRTVSISAIALVFSLSYARLTPDAAAASPTPESACTTLTAAGTYQLTKNLTVHGSCFVIAGSNIALDLGKHSISGDGTGSAITDNGTNFSQIVIANGKISNFLIGIDLTSSSEVSVDSVTSSGNSADGIDVGGIDLGGDSLLDAAKITGNKGAGVIAGGDSLVFSSTISNNGGDGADVGGDSGVDDSKIQGNGGNGISSDSGDNLINGVTASNNAGDGIAISGEETLVTATTASHNKGDGIDLSAEFDSIALTTANSNGGDGVVTVCPSNVYALKAMHNPSNLVETSPPCVNLNNSAP